MCLIVNSTSPLKLLKLCYVVILSTVVTLYSRDCTKKTRLLYFQGIFGVKKMLIKKSSNRKISLNISYPQMYAWNLCAIIGLPIIVVGAARLARVAPIIVQ